MATRGYGHDAETYSRGRPGYPPEALEWLQRELQLGPNKQVLELGAGTGKFTRLLVQTGADVVAVEPVAAMLAQLASELPQVRTLCASAEGIPVGESSADAVICAQSFHWFATPEVISEIRRVLKPDGMLALIWNVRDRSVPWVDALSEIIDRHEGDAPRYDNGEWRTVFPALGFGALQEKSVRHLHSGSAEQVIVDRTASVSFVAALPEDKRRALLEEVRALVAATPELAGYLVDMPYVTRMFWCSAE